MIETSYVLAGSLTGFVVGLTGVGGGGAVILPFLRVGKSRTYATMASRCFGVNPPKAILGLS